MKRVTWKLTLSYVKWIASENFLYGLENLNKASASIQGGVFVINQDEKWWEFQKGANIPYTYGQFMLRFDRRAQNSVTQLYFIFFLKSYRDAFNFN